MSTSDKVLDQKVEIRMRVVEALTRTDGSAARNDPENFLQSVAKITTHVLQGDQTPSAAPKNAARSADKASKASSKNKDNIFD